MNEDLDSQLSAMFDDELPASQCELLARRLARDPELKERWAHYAPLGAATRGEPGTRSRGTVAQRAGRAPPWKPPLVITRASGRPAATGTTPPRWWKPVAGVAVAASVAGLSILWLRDQTPVGQVPLAAQTSVTVGTPTAPPEPDSYVVPVPVERPIAVPVAELANYVVAHSEFSTPLSRRNILSALVASESGTPGEYDESEDEFEDWGGDAIQAP
nr:MAG: hypothetical protein DIU56_12925 [Pseudomonadota bacterium]